MSTSVGLTNANPPSTPPTNKLRRIPVSSPTILRHAENGLSNDEKSSPSTDSPVFEKKLRDTRSASCSFAQDEEFDDEDLLAKLEAANRQLEADTKSMVSLTPTPSPTPGHSRKGSGSSIQSSTSNQSHYSTQQSEEDSIPGTSGTLWDIWGKLVNDWENAKKKPAFLKELVRKGIPHHFRGLAWQLILSVHDSPHKAMYVEYLKQTSTMEKLIRRDIARTFPEQEFFKEKDGIGQESLFNVMKAYSIHDKEVGYCQGSGFIVGLLLMQMPEEEAFAVLVKVMQDYRLRELFKPSMAELGLCMHKLEWLIQELLPDLYQHFQTQGLHTSMYASSWFLTLFSTSFSLPIACRIMDIFISEGMEVIFRMGIAILQTSQDELLLKDMEGMLKFFSKELSQKYEQDADRLFQAAFSLKFNSKKLKKIEKDYTVLKTKENEDQIELRRLRTENRLLRQRIDTLEKESAVLADKLIHDQVTRAQEAEETYALKNNLSTTKQKLADTSRKLEESQTLIADIKDRTLSITSASNLHDEEAQSVIQGLQEELIALRLKEADNDCLVKELRSKISDLNDTNLQLQKAPSNDIQNLQEELIAVKLREAEANLSLKEMRQRVHELESLWEKHIERMTSQAPSPKEKNNKSELKNLQEEVMTVKIREANCLSDLKETKQKVMELETQNQICNNQIRRMDEENKSLRNKMEEKEKMEKSLQNQIKDLQRKMDDLNTQRKEESMMVRIKDAEHAQAIAELKQTIAELEIQKEELLTADKIDAKVRDQDDYEKRIYDLQDEVIEVTYAKEKQEPSFLHKNGLLLMTSSAYDDTADSDEDPESLNRKLTKLLEPNEQDTFLSQQLSLPDGALSSSDITELSSPECLSIPSLLLSKNVQSGKEASDSELVVNKPPVDNTLCRDVYNTDASFVLLKENDSCSIDIYAAESTTFSANNDTNGAKTLVDFEIYKESTV